MITFDNQQIKERMQELMDYMIKKNPDATVRDWLEAMEDIKHEEEEYEKAHTLWLRKQ